jgi:hypothetical protein
MRGSRALVSEPRVGQRQPNSEPVQLNGVARDALLGEEVGHLRALITLELDNLAHLFVVDESAVAGKFLSSPAINSRIVARSSATHLLECL